MKKLEHDLLTSKTIMMGNIPKKVKKKAKK